MALTILAVSAGTAGASAMTVRDDAVTAACRAASVRADRIGRPDPERLPFLDAPGPAEEVVAREAGAPGTRNAESRHRLQTRLPAGSGASVRTSQSVGVDEGRRLHRAPGLALVAAGRLVLFATAPPLPFV